MKKEFKKFVIIIILTIVFILFGIFITKENENEISEKDITLNNMCTDINKAMKNKNNFVIFVTNNLEESGDSNDVIKEYINTYKDKNKIFVLDFKEISYSCIKTMFEKDKLYEILKTSKVNTMIGYKNGQILITQSNILNYIKLEEQLDEYDIIKSKEKKETVTFEEFKNNINQDEYILFILTEENKRAKFENILKEVFADYDYDYVNYYGEEGKKIYSYIKGDLKDANVFPKIIYYQKGRVIKQTVLSEKEEFEEFKEAIEKNN